MDVRVRLFARQREIAAARHVALEIPAGSTIADAWAALVVLHPALAESRQYVRFARNGEYAGPETALGDGDEVACIPPVSGGAGENSPRGAGQREVGQREAGAGERREAGAGERREAGAGENGPGEVAAREAGLGENGPRGAGQREAGARAVAAREAEALGAGPGRILALAPAPFPADLGRALADRLATPADGAVVIFEGRTRETPGTPAPGEEAEARRHAGRRVEALEYEAFETLALRVLGEIADAAAARFGVERLAIVHATGEVPLGEVSVVIVAAAPHRDAAFDAVRFAMDETKARAPIWKAERFADGHVWIGSVARTDPVE